MSLKAYFCNVRLCLETDYFRFVLQLKWELRERDKNIFKFGYLLDFWSTLVNRLYKVLSSAEYLFSFCCFLEKKLKISIVSF